MINYIVGDALEPIGDGNKIIAHVCNNSGGWGRGFVLAISRKWPEPERAYRTWFKTPAFGLGQVSFVAVEPNIHVANMVAQEGYAFINGEPPIRYEALRQCLREVSIMAKSIDGTIHMPRIGCGLAGGRWETVEQIINDVISSPVYVYDL